MMCHVLEQKLLGTLRNPIAIASKSTLMAAVYVPPVSLAGLCTSFSALPCRNILWGIFTRSNQQQVLCWRTQHKSD